MSTNLNIVICLVIATLTLLIAFITVITATKRISTSAYRRRADSETSEVLRAVTTKDTVIWDTTWCSPVPDYTASHS
jgi:hypothetical protein